MEAGGCLNGSENGWEMQLTFSGSNSCARQAAAMLKERTLKFKEQDFTDFYEHLTMRPERHGSQTQKPPQPSEVFGFGQEAKKLEQSMRAEKAPELWPRQRVFCEFWLAVLWFCLGESGYPQLVKWIGLECEAQHLLRHAIREVLRAEAKIQIADLEANGHGGNSGMPQADGWRFACQRAFSPV